MPVNYGLVEIEDDLEDFALRIDAIDPDRVKRKAMKRIGDTMVAYVGRTIASEDDITSPAMNSIYDKGPGPSIIEPRAWRVDESGDGYVVRPKPSVEQRAVVLNYGYPGTITPDGDKPMPININGEPIFRWSVEGPDRTNYWGQAFQKLVNSGQIQHILEEEMEDELERTAI